MTAVQKRDTDVSKVFLTYMTLQGDARRTAHAMGIDVELVRDLAVQEQWDAKLSQYTALKEQDADIQIQINRSLSYVQARQLSMIADNMIKEFSDPERMMALMTTST